MIINLSTEFSRMAECSQDFCSLIDCAGDSPADDWLVRLAEVLPQLHLAVKALNVSPPKPSFEPVPDDEDRFELFLKLYEYLGERDGYTVEFDVMRHGQRLSGSLADDLTDIYYDLKRGLDLLEKNPSEPNIAATEWQTTYRDHWGHHLEDAERQLNIKRA